MASIFYANKSTNQSSAICQFCSSGEGSGEETSTILICAVRDDFRKLSSHHICYCSEIAINSYFYFWKCCGTLLPHQHGRCRQEQRHNVKQQPQFRPPPPTHIHTHTHIHTAADNWGHWMADAAVTARFREYGKLMAWRQVITARVPGDDGAEHVKRMMNGSRGGSIWQAENEENVSLSSCYTHT